jgi:hypothetical protein
MDETNFHLSDAKTNRSDWKVMHAPEHEKLTINYQAGPKLL